jgi:CheY-like chemotaxis protein
MAKRIVIADDSATIQRAFAMTFGAEDVTLSAARSADEGLNLARQIQPELVIADGMMPGRSGYDLCAAIKAEPALSGTAVYILASAQQPYDESRGRQCGADGHFLKPFDTTALIEKVHDALARGPTEKPQPAQVPGEDFGPPMPYDGRTGLPHGMSVPLASAVDEDDYGEFSVDMSPPADEQPATRDPEYATAPATPLPAMRPGAPPASYTPAPAFTPPPASPASLFPPSPSPTPTSAPQPSGSGSGLRPSLIPGIRPGAAAPTRPGGVPMRPTTLGAGPTVRPPAPVSRTLMGLPAANIPIPGTSRSASPPLARPALSPIVSAPSRPALSPAAGGTPSPLFSPAPYTAPPPVIPRPVTLPSTVSVAVSAAVGSAVDQKIAALGARGPEYEAIARLSREIIEQIVWEVVPELAEVIIREHVERHVRA